MSLRPPEPLGTGHDVAGFDCGVETLNAWLRRQAPARDVRLSATFVAADARGRVAGFYVLSAGSARGTGVSIGLRAGAPEPILKLGRTGGRPAAQGRGIGAALVADAFARTYAVSRHAPVAALLADAPDPTMSAWLGKFGFRTASGDPTALFVPLGTIEGAGRTARAGGESGGVDRRAASPHPARFVRTKSGRAFPPLTHSVPQGIAE